MTDLHNEESPASVEGAAAGPVLSNSQQAEISMMQATIEAAAAHKTPSTPISPNHALALEYAKIFPIFCCDPTPKDDDPDTPRKTPLFVNSWVKEATQDPIIITAWFRQNPRALIGIPCAAAGLWVVDCDVRLPRGDKPGVDGLTPFLALAEQNGGLAESIVIVDTVSKNSRHFIFRQPMGAPLGNGTGALPKGVDCRGAGGYIIAPGCRWRDREWRPVQGSLLDDYDKLSEPSRWLQDMVRAPKKADPPPKPAREPEEHERASAPRSEAIGSRERAYAISALAGECNTVASTAEGARNKALNTSALKIGSYVGAGWLDGDMAADELAKAAHACGLPEHEARKTIASGLGAGMKSPHEPLEDKPQENYEYTGDNAQEEASSQPNAGEAPPAGEAPRPLRRELSPAEPFPIDALGDVLGNAAAAIIDKVQCPDSIAAASVLAAASLAVQAHADVLIPATGSARPLSLFVATVAATGERKSAADQEALWPIRKREEKLREEYENEMPSYRMARRAYDVALAKAEKKAKSREEIEAALLAVGPEPDAPLAPILTCEEPTLEGLHKLYAIGQPSLGLFSDEGGSFIQGHAMSDDARLRTVAGLSSLWDGKAIRRIRGGDGSSVLPGRRLAIHLMAQPNAAALMLSDEVLLGQGFLSRMLVSCPTSTVGTRFQKPMKPGTESALRRYGARLLDIMETPPPLLAGVRNALDPRPIKFNEEASRRWLAFADYVEGLLAPGAALEPVKGFANKLPEHVARIAVVLALIDSLGAQAIDAATLDRAIALGDFFTTEALRLFEAGACSPEMKDAQKLLAWLHSAWQEPTIGLRVIYRLGPNSIREAAVAQKAVKLLEEHGWLIRVPGGSHVVAGEAVREAWRIVRAA
jgi:hypothetical protein